MAGANRLQACTFFKHSVEHRPHNWKKQCHRFKSNLKRSFE
jgi:hypothetical protein